MKKILNKVETNLHHKVCPMCKCHFSYEDDDIELHSILEGQVNNLVQFVSCPNCGGYSKHQFVCNNNNLETLAL